MQTKRKGNSVVTTQLLEDGRIRFSVLGAGDLILDPRKVHAANQAYAAIHGWIQRVSDAAAMSRDPDTGKPATPADKFAAMKARIEHYESGSPDWRMVGTGFGGHSITVEAIARVKGISCEDADAHVDRFADAHHGGDRKAALAFLREGKRVQEAIRALQAERLPAPKVDADKALEELK